MADGPIDPRWPSLLSLSAHELRSPLSVIGGYLRMLLKDLAGPLSDPQRRLLEEAEKSCARLSRLAAEMSELAQLESGTAPANRGTIDLRLLLTEVAAALPEMPDRTMVVEVLAEQDGPMACRGDAVRLKTAFGSLLGALRRELVTSDRLVVHVEACEEAAGPSVRVTVGEPDRIASLRRVAPSEMATFDEWRGGSGLSLPNARRIIEAHGGRLWSAAEDGKSSAIAILPLRQGEP